MRICPNCGYENDDSGDVCVHCDRALPVPATSGSPDTPEQPGATETAAPTAVPGAAAVSGKRATSFLLGAGVGLVPAVLFAIGTINSWGIIGCFLFVLVLLMMAIFLSQRDARTFGYGLLAAVLISPIIVAISCSANPLRL